MTSKNELPGAPAHKLRLSKGRRLLRLIGAALDPRAWIHPIRLINYYNYTHVIPRRTMKIGPGCRISPNVSFQNAERIEIGARVGIGAHCYIWGGPGRGRVVIGEDTLFGPDVLVTAAGYRYNDGAPVTKQASDEADVIIGRDVWLGARVIVLPGAVIGDGAIIGAGSLVRGAIPAMAVAVGTPARVVGTRRIGESKPPAAEG